MYTSILVCSLSNLLLNEHDDDDDDDDVTWPEGVKVVTHLFLTLDISATVRDRDMVSKDDQ